MLVYPSLLEGFLSQYVFYAIIMFVQQQFAYIYLFLLHFSHTGDAMILVTSIFCCYTSICPNYNIIDQ